VNVIDPLQFHSTASLEILRIRQSTGDAAATRSTDLANVMVSYRAGDGNDRDGRGYCENIEQGRHAVLIMPV
jgi:hypothetical protein